MLIKWLGHSCFKISVESQSLIIDPFEKGAVNGFRDLDETANIVLCSHLHGDHCGTDCVKLVESKYDSPFEIATVDSYHDEKKGALRGKNLIHIITVQDYYKVVHLGDLGCMLDEKQIERIRDCHVLLIPVGGYYTIGPEIARKIVEAVNPKVTIPMHYRSENFGFDVLKTVYDFTGYFEKVIYLATDTLQFSDELDNEIIVLDYPV
ncbi:MAG TPA: MBL fold metallo-hydrolase [Erysipelotrichaceae bacterium]|nr:MBL fold metallo-hydrolase [Erysipelotrichaceae bacterium]HQB32378.1 MBL fold metallo-hydrolase [Erysipelotrichaceae bacterium]